MSDGKNAGNSGRGAADLSGAGILGTVREGAIIHGADKKAADMQGRDELGGDGREISLARTILQCDSDIGDWEKFFASGKVLGFFLFFIKVKACSYGHFISLFEVFFFFSHLLIRRYQHMGGKIGHKISVLIRLDHSFFLLFLSFFLDLLPKGERNAKENTRIFLFALMELFCDYLSEQSDSESKVIEKQREAEGEGIHIRSYLS